MADYKVVDAQQLDGDLTVLADAIRERAGSEGKMAFPHGMAQTVKSIPTGGVTLPALDHPAGKEDVLRGKEYINGSGQKETGSFTIDDELTEQDALILQISNALRNKASSNNSGTLPPLENPAASTDMATGKELYDQNGNVITGTVPVWSMIGYGRYPCQEDGFQCDLSTDEDWLVLTTPPVGRRCMLEPDAVAIASRPLSDLGNASPEDVVLGKIFTSDAGLSASGTVKEVSTVYNTPFQKATMEWDDDWKASNVLEEDVLLRKGTTVNTWFSRDYFGDAKPGDVVKGKTFTSSAGIQVEGTHECDTGVTLPTLKNPAAASDLVEGKELIDQNGETVTGTLPRKTGEDLTANGAVITVPAGYYETQANKSVRTASLAEPSVSVDNSGKITASVTQEEGYVSGGTKATSSQLPAQAAQIITPGTADQTIASGKYLTGTQTVKGDSNLKAENIKKGVSIFNVEGTMEASAGGYVRKTFLLNANRTTVDTGFSNIVSFVLRKIYYSEIGLIAAMHPAGDIGGTNMYTISCSSYGSFMKLVDTNVKTTADLCEINGGTFTWNGTSQFAMSGDDSYSLEVWGTE